MDRKQDFPSECCKCVLHLSTLGLTEFFLFAFESGSPGNTVNGVISESKNYPSQKQYVSCEVLHKILH